MARRKNKNNIFQTQNLPQSLLILAIAGVVIGLILFNVFSGRGREVQVAKPLLSPAAEQTEPGSKFVPPVELPTTHKVTFGESLAKLSTKYYGEVGLWPGIAKANNLKTPSLITPDTEVKVPTIEEAQKVQIPDLRTTGKDKITSNIYTVDYGDTLFEIAQRAYGDGSKWTEIDKVNNLGRLPNGNPLIHAGNVLVVPR